MDIREASPQEKKQPVSRLWLYLPFIGIFLLVIGWSIFWFMMADAASRVADGFVLREEGRGRIWHCPDRAFTGFPFRIELTCSAPKVTFKRSTGREEQASLGALSLHVRILSPRHFIALASPPFRIRENMPEQLSLTWDVARVSFEAGQNSIADASAEMRNIGISFGKSESPDPQAKAKSATIHLRHSIGSITGTDIIARIHDFSAPALDLISANTEPVQLEFQASAPGLTLSADTDFRTKLDAWRMAQGNARILVAKITKGTFALDLTGELGLDNEHRLKGNLQGRARGFDAIASRFGKQGGLDMGNLLGKLSGGQGMPVVLTFENGKLRYGPFPLMNLMPVY